MRNKRLLGNSLLLLTAFIWGTAFAAQRNGKESIEPINYNAARTVFAAAAVGTGRAQFAIIAAYLSAYKLLYDL